jgi:hypothetical protein
MFRVFTKDYDRQFERWTDALDAGNSLKSKCKSLFQDVRIFDIGAGVYDKLARLFIMENATMLDVEVDEPDRS